MGFVTSKRKWNSLYYATFWQVNGHKVASPYFLNLYTLFSPVKKIVQFCRYVSLSGLALQSNSADCLVLMLHKQLGNLMLLILGN